MLSVSLTELVTPFDEVSPDTDPLFGVVGKAWWAFVFGGFAVPARVEDTAVILVGVDTIKTGAIGSAYGWF